MSEGELKKRIFMAGYLDEKEPTFILSQRQLDKVLDEAKQDFLTAANTDQSYVTINRNEIAVWEWFKKWFGKDEKWLKMKQ